MSEFHVIPVPHGWSVEQSWEAISRGDELTDPKPNWASIEVADNRLVAVHPVGQAKATVECGKCGGPIHMVTCPLHDWVIASICLGDCPGDESAYVVDKSCKECRWPKEAA